MTRVLLLTTEPLPLPGLPASGAGLRAWALAEALRTAGLDAALWMPREAAATYASKQPQEAAAPWPEWVGTFERAALAAAVAAHRPDAIVMQHWGLARELGEVECPLAIDLAGPHLFERALWGSAAREADIEEKLAALRRADFVTASGAWQRHYFLAWLHLAGWDATDPAIAPLIPYSWRAAQPPAPPRADRLVYGGYCLPWQDPTAALETALEALDVAGRGELLFIGGAHPSLDVSRGRFEPLLARLAAHPRVRMAPSMPFDDYFALLREGGVALDLMARNGERELAFTTRTVVYLAAGLPVIHDNYSELGQWIAEAGAGWTFDPEDRDGLRALLAGLLGGLLGGAVDPAPAAAAAHALVAARMDPDATAAPLIDFCRAPAFREGKMRARLGFEERGRQARELAAALEAARGELATLRGKRWVRWGLAATSARGWMRLPMTLLAGAIGLALIPVFWLNDRLAKTARRG